MSYLSSQPQEQKLPLSLTGRYLRQNAVRLTIIAIWVILLVYCVRFIFSGDLVETFLILIMYVLIISILNGYVSQTFREGALLFSIIRLHGSVNEHIKTGTTSAKVQIQPKFESVRRNMIKFVDVSTTVFPPISEFGFEKLRKSIDVYFYAAGMTVLSEKPDYSTSEEKQSEIEKELRSEEDELEEMAVEAEESATDEITGHVSFFGFVELRSFLKYLANRIFRKDTIHPFHVEKYPMNVVDLTSFFNRWNDILMNSKNGADFARSAKEALRVEKNFESHLWVIVTSYYSMFYAALALLASEGIRAGRQVVHKVVADALIHFFISNRRLAKMLEAYEEAKETSLELIGREELMKRVEKKADELVVAYERERGKRSKFQYDVGEMAKRGYGETSLRRARDFVSEVRKILSQP